MAGHRRSKPYRRLFLFLAMAAIASAAVGPSSALPAAAQEAGPSSEAEAPVEELNKAILELMRTADHTDARTRLQRFEPVLRSTYDLETALRVITAPYYDRADPAEQRALADAFARRSAAQYVDRFDAYSGERIEITGERPGPRGTRLVDTLVVRPKKDPVQLTYVVRQHGGRWGIVDVLAKGSVSQLAVQRSDFASTLRGGGIPALISELNRNAEQLVAG